jgi:hypothetical protein
MALHKLQWIQVSNIIQELMKPVTLSRIQLQFLISPEKAFATFNIFICSLSDLE